MYPETVPGDVPAQPDGDDARDGAQLDGDRPPPREDRYGRQDPDDTWDPWRAPAGGWGAKSDEPWSDGQWNHSWGKAERGWYGSGWAWDYSHGYGKDTKWNDSGAWASASTGSGSSDGNGQDRDSRESFSDNWGRRDSTSDFRSHDTKGYWQQPEGWRPSSDGQGNTYQGGPRGGEGLRGPSEKMIVPSFSGNVNEDAEDLGSSARSYLRQVSAWRRMTRMSKEQQALTLYQHLTDRAWIDAERLDMDRLASTDGVDYLLSWIKDRYLDVQVTQVGRSLSDFFRRLRKKPSQPMREYMADFDRAYARLSEVGCQLPDVAAAWVFVDRMGLEEQAELNLLASVGNQYSLKALQQAAIVHDRGLRKPWEAQPRGSKKDWNFRKPHTANMAGPEDFFDEPHDIDDKEDTFDEGNGVPEDVAEDLYVAFMSHETAKQKYRENSKLRGSDPDALRALAAEKLKMAKAKSFCSGCKRRGHWHKDAICPLNKGASNQVPTATSTSTPPGNQGQGRDPPRSNFPCHVAHVTWDLNGSEAAKLLAITDTACSKSVAGNSWVDSYIEEAKRCGCEPQFVSCKEAFRFGASKVFVAGYAIVICFSLGNYTVALKVAVVNGEVPLLVSRPALARMGMIMDIEANTASFKKLQVADMELTVTETGHPAFPVHPAALPAECQSSFHNGSDAELQIFSKGGQYMECNDGDFAGVEGSLLEIGDFGDVYDGCAVSWMTTSQQATCGSSTTLSTTTTPRLEAPVVHASCPPEPVRTGTSLSEPSTKQRTFTSLFYPKKIAAVTKNFLLDANFNVETFMNWWKTTNISNDFWVEDECGVVRVHVVPRRSFFSPSNWNTSQQKHKELLLSSLGEVRTTQALSCKNHRPYPEVHGTWRHDRDHSTFPMLWVGRTIFRRKKLMPTPSSVIAPRDHGVELPAPDCPDDHEAQDPVGVHQERVDRRSEGTESLVPRVLDNGGAAFPHPGGPSGCHQAGPSLRDVQVDHRRAQEEGRGEGLRTPPVRDEGHDPQNPQGPERHGVGVTFDLRTFPREEFC